MTKRLTATEKWADPWFFSLKPMEKLFWIYLLDNCNHAGIWDVNWTLALIHLGGPFEFDEATFRGRITVLEGGQKWFVPKFIEFQYKGHLNHENRAHQSVIDILKREGLWPLSLSRKEKNPLPLPLTPPERGKGLARALEGATAGAKDKDKATDKVLDKDKATDTITRAREIIAPPRYAVDCESCGVIESWEHHKHCHYCFKPFPEGVPNASHTCRY